MRQSKFIVHRYLFVLGIPESVSIAISAFWTIVLIWFVNVIGQWVVATAVTLMLIGLIVHLHDLRILRVRGYGPADVRRRFIALTTYYYLLDEAKLASTTTKPSACPLTCQGRLRA